MSRLILFLLIPFAGITQPQLMFHSHNIVTSAPSSPNLIDPVLTNWNNLSTGTITGGQADNTGGTSGVKFVPNTSNIQHFFQNNFTKAAGNISYQFIGYFKPSGYDHALVAFQDAATGVNGFYIDFILTTNTVNGSPTVYGVGYSVQSQAIVTDANGFSKITINFTTGGETSVSCLVGTVSATPYAGDGTSGVFAANFSVK